MIGIKKLTLYTDLKTKFTLVPKFHTLKDIWQNNKKRFFILRIVLYVHFVKEIICISITV